MPGRVNRKILFQPRWQYQVVTGLSYFNGAASMSGIF